MSTNLAIAAVTIALRTLIEKGTDSDGEIPVTILPLDKAKDQANLGGEAWLNLFLYQTQISPAWRNNGATRQVANSAGETWTVNQAPLGLNLYYLLTAHEKNEGATPATAHRLLGRGMLRLHDHPLLGREEIRNVIHESELQNQVERIRITPQPLSLDEISKLWMVFQTGYRISAAYEVSVVLIESALPARSAAPVLSRGPGDQGVTALPSSDLPTLDELELPHSQSSLFPGDALTVMARNTEGLVNFRFTNQRLNLTLNRPPDAVQTPPGLQITIPNNATFPAGLYTVAAVVARSGHEWTSNELPFSIAPRIESIAPPSPVARDAQGNVTLTIQCTPDVRLMSDANPPGVQFTQRIALLLDPLGPPAKRPSLQAAPEAPTGQPPSTNSLKFVFQLKNMPVGDYRARLRVDGVDMARVDWQAQPPGFAANQNITIT